jgi:hypothetical protein
MDKNYEKSPTIVQNIHNGPIMPGPLDLGQIVVNNGLCEAICRSACAEIGSASAAYDGGSTISQTVFDYGSYHVSGVNDAGIGSSNAA